LAPVSNEKLVSGGNCVCIGAQDQTRAELPPFPISNNLANLGLVFATKKDPNSPLERERGDHIEILTASAQFSNSEVLNESL
jgi:hypothetical protein